MVVIVAQSAPTGGAEERSIFSYFGSGLRLRTPGTDSQISSHSRRKGRAGATTLRGAHHEVVQILESEQGTRSHGIFAEVDELAVLPTRADLCNWR